VGAYIYRPTICHIPEDENFVVTIITNAFWPNFFVSFLNGHLLSRCLVYKRSIQLGPRRWGFSSDVMVEFSKLLLRIGEFPGVKLGLKTAIWTEVSLSLPHLLQTNVAIVPKVSLWCLPSTLVPFS